MPSMPSIQVSLLCETSVMACTRQHGLNQSLQGLLLYGFFLCVQVKYDLSNAELVRNSVCSIKDLSFCRQAVGLQLLSILQLEATFG